MPTDVPPTPTDAPPGPADGAPRGRRVLIVDDDPRIRSLHARMVRELGHEVETAADGLEAMEKLVLDIDLVLLDAEMPIMDGFDVAREIRGNPEHAFLPIVMVTGLEGRAEHRRAMESGVNDFLTKPINPDTLELRSRWLLQLKEAQDRLVRHQEDLHREVERKTAELRRALERMTDARRDIHYAHLDTIRRLTIAAEYKDTVTAGHIERIGLYSEILAARLGLSPSESETLRHAAPMHDVGKLGIPDRVLLKPARLEPDEWEIMKSHTVLGARLLSSSSSPVLQKGEVIARSHHERWDGTGYPDGLAGEEIPIEARICSVVDYFDAVTMDRPYRAAIPEDRVLTEMRGLAGRHFDPQVLSAFFESLPRIHEVQESARG